MILFRHPAYALLALVISSGAFASDRDCGHHDRGKLLDYERVASYANAEATRSYFDEWIAFYQDYYSFPADLPAKFTHGFDSYKVRYCTVDAAARPGKPKAKATVATGMLSVPRSTRPLSTVLYLHGTSVSFYDAVSNPKIYGSFNEFGESFDGPPSNAVFAGNGFIYAAPDYLGLGDSTVPRHRYFHAATEASAAVDMLAAARRVLSHLPVRQREELFLFGFSQGGHAALAAQRELEQQHMEVTGTATVGAVLDVERWFLDSLQNDTTVTLPLYMSYLLLAYDDIYDVYRDTSDVFREPYAASVEDLFDMQHYFDDVLAGLPADTRSLLTSSFFTRVTHNPWHEMRVRLRQNAVDAWSPDAPIRLYHGTDDEEVSLDSALGSAARLRNHGARVSVRTLAGFDHVNSWIQAMPRAVTWFRSME